jgi:CheY-like chemotaxis protein
VANELILIVEDNPKNLKLVRDTLQVKGYRTIEAGTGEEGVQLARDPTSRSHPDGYSFAGNHPEKKHFTSFAPIP